MVDVGLSTSVTRSTFAGRPLGLGHDPVASWKQGRYRSVGVLVFLGQPGPHDWAVKRWHRA